VRASLRIAVLAAWSGSLIAYALFAIAPAFEVGLPSSLAADLLRRGFDGLDRAGMVAGASCALLSMPDLRRGGGPGAWLRAAIPLAAAAGHALSYFWVTPELAALRHAAGGSVGQLAVGDPGLARFAWLHQLSRTLYVSEALTGLGCCLWEILVASLGKRASGSARS
jgi:hypothetical protein